MRIVNAQDEQAVSQSTPVQIEDTISISSESTIQAARDVCAFIGRGVHFKGTMTYQGTIRIDGRFDGDITTDGVVLVSEGAELNADVSAGTIVSKGKITGDISVKEKLIVQAPSVIIGEVTAPKLIIEEGALLDGRLRMGQDSMRQDLMRQDSMRQDSRVIKREPVLRPVRSSEQFVYRRAV